MMRWCFQKRQELLAEAPKEDLEQGLIQTNPEVLTKETGLGKGEANKESLNDVATSDEAMNDVAPEIAYQTRIGQDHQP